MYKGYGKRLKESRKYRGLTQKEFAENIGMEWHKIRDLESEKLTLSPDTAEEIEKIYFINGWWLLTGKGEMIPSESKNLPIAPNKPQYNNDQIAVNYYPDIFAAAGYGATNGDSVPEIMTVSRSFLFNMFGLTSFVGIDIIHVVGDSMEPFVHNGETILLHRTGEARNNQVIIARIGGDLFVKRLLRDPLGRWVKLISDNSLYPDIELNQEEMHQLEIIGVVYGRYRPIS